MVFLGSNRQMLRPLVLGVALCVGSETAHAFAWGAVGNNWGGRGFGGGAFNGPRMPPMTPIGPRIPVPHPPIIPRYGYGVPRIVFRAPHFYPRYPYGYGLQPSYPVIQQVYPPPVLPPPVIVSSGPKSVSPPASSLTTAPTAPPQSQESAAKPFSCVRNHTLKLTGDEAGQKTDLGCISP
jgi:hypothetical protein